MKVLKNLILYSTTLSEPESSDLAASIFDWRDEDESINAGGAESREYRSKSPPYRSKNLPFETLEELLLVHGMTPDTWVLITPYLTLNGAEEKNLNFLPTPILKAYGFGDGVIDTIHRFRKGRDEIIGTPDDGILTDKGSVVALLERTASLERGDRRDLEDHLNSGMFGVTSTVYRVNIEARIKYRRESLNRSCVISQLGRIYYCQNEFFSIDRSEIKEFEVDEKK